MATCIFDLQYCTYVQSKEMYRPLNLQVNIMKLLDFCNVKVRYNEMSKEVEWEINELDTSQANRNEISLEWLYDKCILLGFVNLTKDRLNAIILSIADKNRYHPVKEFILSNYKNYNGKFTEIEKVLNSVKTNMIFDQNLKNTLITTWLVSCVKAVFDGKIKSEGVLVLQGEQGAFKTTWLKKLFGMNFDIETGWMKDGQGLDPDNKDNVYENIKYWTIELGELETTIKKEIGKIKSFISKDFDELRLPYARATSKFPRQTVFCASVNYAEFLKDKTGNRRWWVIPVVSIDKDIEFDIKQLWCEIYQLYLNGHSHRLNNEDETKLNISNKAFESKDYVDTMLEISFNWDKEPMFIMKSRDILNVMDQPKGITTTAISQALKRRGVRTKIVSKSNTFLMPIPYKYQKNEMGNFKTSTPDLFGGEWGV